MTTDPAIAIAAVNGYKPVGYKRVDGLWTPEGYLKIPDGAQVHVYPLTPGNPRQPGQPPFTIKSSTPVYWFPSGNRNPQGNNPTIAGDKIGASPRPAAVGQMAGLSSITPFTIPTNPIPMKTFDDQITFFRERYGLPRLTVRRLMIAVAVFGIMIWLFLNIYVFFDNLFTEYFHIFNNPIRKVWNVGPSPSVIVDLLEGSITAVPGMDGEVAADIDTGVGTKESRAAGSEQALKTLDLGFHRWGNSIRITLKGLSKAGMNYGINVKLSVPRGVDLDLRTGRGNIYIGQYCQRMASAFRRPSPPPRSEQRTLPDYRLANAQGSIELWRFPHLKPSGDRQADTHPPGRDRSDRRNR